MKIFNWVQRKLHQNVVKDGLAKNVKKIESSEIDKNTKAILEQVGLVEVLENWVDGVLAIGTFGFDTLKYSDDKEKDDCFVKEEGDGDEDEDEDGDESVDLDDSVGDDDVAKKSVTVYHGEEMDPLISYYQNVEGIGSDHDGDDLGFAIMDPDLIAAVDCVDLTPAVEVDQYHGQKRRTTLAELFMADTDSHFKKSSPDSLEIESDYDKYKFNRSKSHLSFAKKIMSRGKEQESRPIKKLHQMMKRMLKRKIHPDVDVAKFCKSDGQNKPIKKNEAIESVHLLYIPEPVV